MSEGIEQFPKKPKMELSDKDCEMIGREFASVDSKMAKVYLAASHMSEEDINRIISSTEKIPEKKGYKMDTEEKKEFYRKMAEVEEEEAKKKKGRNQKTPRRTCQGLSPRSGKIVPRNKKFIINKKSR